MAEPGRTATVVLVRRGEVLGALAPVLVAMPWWPEVREIVAAVRERDGIEITVLRVLRLPTGRTSGGHVTYLAETDRVPTSGLSAWSGDPLIEQPHRQAWARPDGAAELLGWARRQLDDHGLVATGPAEQMRTWNLSALWRIPTTTGPVWLKAVPDFFAHEGAVISWIGAPLAPRLISFARGRSLMYDLADAANHELRDPAALHPMVDELTGLQLRAVGHLDALMRLGVPDRRLPSMVPRIATVIDAWGSALDGPQRRLVDALITDLPARLAAVEACGVPDTLVHGDFHPGNVAGRSGRYVILDWGDSFVGHPLVDELAFVQRLPAPVRTAARSWFVDAWVTAVPGSDPARAARLLEPVVSLLAAVMYAGFCAAIEPDERVYHAAHVGWSFRAAAESLATLDH